MATGCSRRVGPERQNETEFSGKSLLFFLIVESVLFSAKALSGLIYDKSNGGGMKIGNLLLGVLLGIVLVPVVALVWLRLGKVPVAVADPSFPREQWLADVPLNARIQRELVKIPPVQYDEDNLVAGAHVYREKCASCHGMHGKPSAIGPHMFPEAPPLWESHHHNGAAEGSIGVSDDPPGETQWKVLNGIRLTGMPAFKTQLTDTEIWQVSLLVANADKPLPPAALEILLGTPPAPAADSAPK
jgi:mono/diheme cytochrome c family protein